MSSKTFSWLCAAYGKPIAPIIIGICLGMTVNFMFAPFLDESDCSAMDLTKNIDNPGIVKLRETKSFQENPQEQVINLEPRVIQSKAMPVMGADKHKLKRARYISTELGIREKLFVAVLSSRETLNSLGVAVNKTLSHYVTKTVFFTDAKVVNLPKGMSLVSFSDHHPHMLPIHILRYISEHYVDTYDFYMFITDRTYLRGEKIFDIVSHISVKDDVHMGVPHPEGKKLYCVLGGGIIFSQSVIAKVLPKLEWCLKNVKGHSASDVLGSCITLSANIPCSNKLQDHVYLNERVEDFDYSSDIKELAEKEHFNKSVSVFPLPDDIDLYKLHRYFCLMELNKTRLKIEEMRKEVWDMSQYAPGGRSSVSWPIGVPEQYKPKIRFDVIRWDYWTDTHVYMEDEFSNMRELKGANRQSIKEMMRVAMDRLNEKYGDRYRLNKLVNGYRRFDPARGMEYIIDLELKDVKIRNTFTQRRVHLVQPLGGVEIVPMPYVTENTRVNFILPITIEDRDGAKAFIDQYAKICLDTGDNSYLFIVFIYKGKPTGDDIFATARSTITYYENKYQTGAKIAWADLHVQMHYISQFTIMNEVTKKFSSDSILFFCSTTMEMETDFLNRIRMNTIKGHQVFYPMGFQQYKPNFIYEEKPYPPNVEIKQNFGYYDTLGHDHFSFYNSDYIEAKKYLSAADSELQDLFYMFVKFKKLHIFKAVEPSLRYRYKEVRCNSEAPPDIFKNCLVRKDKALAGRSVLAKLVFEQEKLT